MSSAVLDEVVERKSSTHKTEVVPVVLEKHPDADSLSVVNIYGYQCVVRTSDWAGISKAYYVVPDSCVDVRRPEFAFLAADANADGIARVKARRLRGVVSYGLLVPAPEDAVLGDDYAEQLGVARYEPPEPGANGGQRDRFLLGGENESEPPIPTGPGKYDVESFERYHDVLAVGEPVDIREKTDGSNCRVLWWDGRLWVKTRNNWVKRVPDYSHITREYLLEKGCPEDKVDLILSRKKVGTLNSFWEVVERTPGLVDYLSRNPGTTVFGEIAGSTNRLKYQFPNGNRFIAFDLYRQGRFVDVLDAETELRAAGVPFVPSLTDGPVPYEFGLVKRLADGKSVLPDAKPGIIREGVVVKPIRERSDRRVGRVILKSVNPDFLAK